MTEIELPDGTILEVPEHASPDFKRAVRFKMLQKFPELDKRGVFQHLKDTAVNVGIGASEVADFIRKGAAALAPPPLKPFITLSGGKEQEALQNMLSEESKAASAAVGAAAEKGAVEALQELKERPSAAVELFARSLPYAVGGGLIGRGVKALAPGLSGAAAGAVGEGAITGMSLEAQAREKLGRELTPEELAAIAAASALTGAIGYAGARLSPVDIDSLLAAGRLSSQQAGVLKRLFLGPPAEMAEEALQSGQERMWQNYIEDKPITQGAAGEAVIGGTAGLIGGTIASLIPQAPESKSKITPESEPAIEPKPEIKQAPPIAEPLIDADEEAVRNIEIVDRVLKGQPLPERTEVVSSPKFRGIDEAQIIDTGMSEEVIANVDNFADPNTSIPRSERKIWAVLGGNEQLEQKITQRLGDITDQDIDTSQGPVVITVGQPSDVRPDFYLRGLMRDVYDLAREFDPRGVYVILPEDAQAAGDPRGISGYAFTRNGITYLVPRHLTHITPSGSHWLKDGENLYSTYAKFDAWSTLRHEFTHSLIDKYFYQGLQPEEIDVLKQKLKRNEADEALLSKLSPGARALIQRWLEFRSDVLNNRISGREAAARWLSPAKLQKKVTLQGIPNAWNSTEWTSAQLKEAIDRDDKRLSLEEFIAEQMPKYLYARGDLAKSQMMQEVFAGKFDSKEFEKTVEERIAEFFRPLIDLLRRVFRTMQIKGMIDATQEFKDWLNELSLRNRAEPPMYERINWEHPSRQQVLKSALSSLVRERKLNGNSRQYKRLRQMLIMGDYEELTAELKSLLGDRFTFDQKQIEAKGWQTIAKDEQAFKEWFGKSLVVDAEGKPLPVFYSVGTEFRIDGEIYPAFFSDFLSAPWLANAIKQEARERKTLAAYLAFQPEQTATEEVSALTPDKLLEIVRKHKEAGKSAIILKSKEFKGNVYIPLDSSLVAVDPAFKLEESHLNFDLTDPEEAEGAKQFSLMEKLKLPRFARSLPKLYRMRNYLLQISQIAHLHPEWYWLTYFRQNQIKFYRRAAQLHHRADAAVRQLNAYFMGKENLARMYKLTLDEYRSGEHLTQITQIIEEGGLRHFIHKPTEKLLAKVRTYGVNPDSPSGKRFISAYLSAKNALQYQMDKMEETLLNLTVRKYNANPRVMEAKVREIVSSFAELRAVPFWPQLTFGRWRVKVYDGERVIYDAGTDNESEWAELEAEARRKYPGKRIEVYSMPGDFTPILMRLPAEFLGDVANLLNIPLDSDEIDAIRELMHTHYAKTPLTTFDPNKRYIVSNSTDFLRNFADFSLRTSNLIAKIEYRRYLNEAVATAERLAQTMPAGDARADLTRTAELMRETIRYMMDPQEEMHRARSTIALLYLWGNVKTALLNFWGLVNTWAFLNRELGYVEGTKLIGQALKGSAKTLAYEWHDATLQLLHGSQADAFLSLTDPNWEMVDGKPTELRLAVEQAKRENVLDQSYANYLAGQASSSDLARLASRSVAGKGLKIAVDAGMALFRATELLIRRATFIAAYKAFDSTRPNWSMKQKYQKAVEATLILQADYTKGNRAKFMRGKLQSLLFIFMTFVQNASWATYGGIDLGLKRQEAIEGRISPAWYRSYSFQMVLLMLAVAGLMGLPGAEDLFSLVNIFWKRFIRPGESLEVTLQKVLREWDVDPMLVMRGLSFNLGGVDVSRSIGLGHLVPGVDELSGHYNSSREWMGSLVGSFAGVAGGYGLWLSESMLRVLNSLEDGDAMHTVGKQLARMPGGIGNMAKAIEWSAVDARGPAGGLLAWEDGKPRELTAYEIFMKGLGFQPAAVSRHQTIRMEQRDAAHYWTARRKLLLDNYFTAVYIEKDREASADVREAIRKFNRMAPRDLRISPKTISQSMKARLRAMEAEEQLTFPQKSLQPLSREISEAYSEP